MPHPTTPSSDEEVTGPSCSSEGANLQTTMAEFDVIERPFTTTPLSNPLKSPLSVKADVRCPADVVPTPPQSPVRSSLWKPPSYRADPEIPSPPITPESQRYSKAPTITGRHIKAGSDSCKGLTERLTEQLAVGGHDKGLDGGTRNMGNEKARNIPIATELMAGHQERPIGWSQPPVVRSSTGIIPLGIMPEKPRGYEGTFNLQVGPEGHYEEYGRGAWSVVYRARHVPDSRIYGDGVGAKKMVAVKAPILQGSVSVLEHEALILTYLQPKVPPAQGLGEGFRHIVSFLGYHTPTKSLVLESVPLTLAGYSNAKAVETKKNFSHKTIRDPVVGMQTWLYIARELIGGLEFLQNRSVVHGDIKPTNILIRPRTATGGGSTPNENIPLGGEGQDFQDFYTPIFCDFSSSSLIHPTIPPTEPSALTDRFAAPELLDYRKPGITTFSSDIYSLAVTLLSPALGADVYAAAANQMQALHWAKEGRPLDFARNTEGGLRVKRGGVVDRVVGGAARKEQAGRRRIGEWMEVVKKVVGEEEDKKVQMQASTATTR
ncbi:MAG: hypothetical protein M1813_005188 [Trichoglossum hirsutum]|nr:MAG: hypothetical protein M1813_005188 [Trichoglossum hirsutum]